MPAFLIITMTGIPGGAPAGAAINRIEADAAFDLGPGLSMLEDDGSPIWAPPAPDQPRVPVSVPNADMRVVLQGHFLPDGRSLYTAIQTMLSDQRDATASLPDNDPNKRAALAAWTRWDMGNFFLRAEPMIAGIRDAFGFSDEQVDELFIEAAALA